MNNLTLTDAEIKLTLELVM